MQTLGAVAWNHEIFKNVNSTLNYLTHCCDRVRALRKQHCSLNKRGSSTKDTKRRDTPAASWNEAMNACQGSGRHYRSLSYPQRLTVRHIRSKYLCPLYGMGAYSARRLLLKFHVRNGHKSYGHILNLCASTERRLRKIKLMFVLLPKPNVLRTVCICCVCF